VTALDGELGKFFDNGNELELGNGWNALRPLKATRNPLTGSIDVSVVANPGRGAPYVIAAGVIALTATSPDVQIDNEAAAASDNLDTITAHADMGPGSVVVLRSTSSSRDPTIKHATGNILLTGGADFTMLGATNNRIGLMWSGVRWHELWRF
jgi:hypothetical protein